MPGDGGTGRTGDPAIGAGVPGAPAIGVADPPLGGDNGDALDLGDAGDGPAEDVLDPATLPASSCNSASS